MSRFNLVGELSSSGVEQSAQSEDLGSTRPLICTCRTHRSEQGRVQEVLTINDEPQSDGPPVL